MFLIFGYDYIKKVVLFLFFGGEEKNFDNGGYIWGDINIFMVGDFLIVKF